MTDASAADSGSEAVTIEPADADSAEVAGALAAYFAELNAAFGYEDGCGAPTAPGDFTPPRGRMFVVRDREDGEVRGCGAVRLLDPSTAEVKRMWLHSSLRGRGIGRMLLRALEREAVALGATRAVLDTNETLTSALGLYRSAGWQEVPSYNDNAEATHWFAKDL